MENHASTDLVHVLGTKSAIKDSRIFGVALDIKNGSPVLIWDTGTSRTLISSRLAQELGLDLHPTKHTWWKDSGGKQIIIGDVKFSFRLFGRVYNDHPVEVFRQEVFPNADGFLGTDIVLRCRWTINPANSSILIGASMPDKNLAVIPLTIEKGFIYLKVKINGNEVWSMLDTGLSDTTLPPHTVKQLGLKGWDTGLDTPNLGNFDYTTGDLQIGGLTFTGCPLYLMKKSMRDFPMLGQSVLNRLVYTVDPEKKTMTVHEKLT